MYTILPEPCNFMRSDLNGVPVMAKNNFGLTIPKRVAHAGLTVLHMWNDNQFFAFCGKFGERWRLEGGMRT